MSEFERFMRTRPGGPEVEGEGFTIHTRNGQRPVAVIAPHGGCIEPGTSEIADAIAGDDCFMYDLKGLGNDCYHRLHLTSHKFDEERCLELVAQCDVVVSVHGLRREGNSETIFLGGRDNHLRTEICAALRAAGFDANNDPPANYGARNPRNVCNRGRTNAGVQLEIRAALRQRIRQELQGGDGATLETLANAVRHAIC